MKFSLSYEDKESKDYSRSLVTTSIMNLNTVGDVVFDFYEEYVKPRVSTKITDDSTEFSQKENEVVIIREKKTTVVMSKETALQMADWIISHYQTEGGK
ncbi:hypothetical protein [Paenibacillus sp. y28]|uniref:hypothetical protein n=1 Tax=Paenibacillus sp. y28 TaxID=3129110 RepID=UPI0030159A48